MSQSVQPPAESREKTQRNNKGGWQPVPTKLAKMIDTARDSIYISKGEMAV
jgi:hypothetical protein